MSAIAKSSQYPAGHPLWHLLIVAGGAIGVFIAIKTKEYWDRQIQPRRARRAGQVEQTTSGQPSGWRPPATPLSALALLSVASAGIHASVSAEHFQEAFIFGAFFLAASTAQSAWAVLVLHRPNRTLLITGAAGNSVIIALWTITRTIGLPIGPEPWHPETIGTRDIISTLCELSLVLGATILLTTNHRLHRREHRSRNDGSTPSLASASTGP